MSEVNEFLKELDADVKWQLDTSVQIDESEQFPDVEKLGLENRRWIRIEDVVAVVADLKGSTQMEFKGRRSQSTTRLYEAVKSFPRPPKSLSLSLGALSMHARRTGGGYRQSTQRLESSFWSA